MTNYEKIILNDLLDRYERSKSFTGDNKVNQQFTVKLAKLFPKYDDAAEYDLFQAVSAAISALEKQKYITVKRHKNGEPDSVTLNIEALEQIYTALGRKAKADIHDSLRSIMTQYQTKNDILSAYCNEQIQRLSKNKKVEFYDDDLESYENILKAVSQIMDIQEETYMRDFSIRVFGDSKIFEKIRSKVIRLLFRYGDFPEEDSVLEDLNIVRNPGHVYLKGCGTVTVAGQKIDLSVLNGDIAFSSDLLKQIEQIQVTGNRVVTIKNLTSFHAFSEPDTFAVYLGGYHNTHRRNLIRMIYAQNSKAAYFHYGDIDAGGFYILLHLRKKTGVSFQPYHMDIATLEQYSQFTKPLTEHDKNRLKNLQSGEFGETVTYMLEHNCKLEQEALDS